MPVESIKGRGATRNATPTRFNLQERLAEGAPVAAQLVDRRPAGGREDTGATAQAGGGASNAPESSGAVKQESQSSSTSEDTNGAGN